LVAIHHPDNHDPSTEGEAMVRDIDVLNEEMEVAGASFRDAGLTSGPLPKIMCCSCIISTSTSRFPGARAQAPHIEPAGTEAHSTRGQEQIIRSRVQGCGIKLPKYRQESP
jgi:hypothetical protein